MWSSRLHLCALVGALGVVTAALACRRSSGSPTRVATDRGLASAEADGGIGRGPSELGSLGSVLPPGDPGVVDVILEVQADREARPISPLIYGINYDLRDAANQRWGVVRSGGNRLTAYNWENNASNAGSDYLFQNDGLIAESNEPAKPLLELIDAAAAISAASVITISNADYVSADKNGDGDVRKSGASYLTARFKRNRAKKPTPFAALPAALDDFVYQDELVAFLKTQRPAAKLIFSMDNEPDLWAHTHAEIFSSPLTYADLWRRNHDFAKATKQAWPGAQVLGFVSYGYTGYVSLQNAPDGAGRNFIEWYLDQAKAAEKSDGMRLIDYLDLHWYPEAQGGGERIVGDGAGAEVVAARVQAPRSLWDAKYEEKSWIRDVAGGPINLLHWVQAKIDAHYPGTKLAFSEWNFGGGKHISGSIAVADVLGIFGKYGVGLATYWPMSHEEPFPYAAFRAFRNYDGRGGAFGDVSIAASSSNVSVATVYGSIRSSDPARTVIVAINKATKTKKAGLAIRHAAVYATAKVYVLAGTQAVITEGPLLSAVATNAFNYDMPAQSVSILVPQL